ncbi:hypothetical protein [Flavihumibacter sp. UBA7668]|uniref:hypothetical protein n=1 Tax=Flavihumibacter sp. UBA7668 TaxID=1946542 RepID=UPI0025C2ACDA|nr:hypothetical protein [Flavihumibacter sp. UBA7668]
MSINFKSGISILFILLAAALFSCQKSKPGTPASNPPVPVNHGTAIGTATSKTIGTDGGRILSADGAIQVDIPQGAVSSLTNFTIQPVTLTLQSGTGNAYRLGPENVNFEKEVTITIRYTNDDLIGTNENDLYLAYQDKEGYWHRAIQTTIDKENKKLQTKTRHFSDWTIQRLFYINAEKYALSANEETTLTVTYSDAIPGDELLSPDIEVPSKNIEEWFVNGPGTIGQAKKSTSNYKAPEVISAPQTIAVGVRIKNMVSQRHPDRPGNTGLVLVQVPIQLTPDEYFTWEIDGSSHIGLSLDAAVLGTTTILGGTGLTGGVNITLNAGKAGNYDMGSATNPDNFNMQVFLSSQSNVIYQGTYYNCNESTPRYGNGKLVISSFGSIGGIIEGEFTATVYTRESDCYNKSKQITGKFRMRRKA